MTGSAVEAPVTAEMLVTIFTPYSPLHDGAVLIAGDRIRCAGAILPLTQSPISDRSLGTRHRAALGLSEETDAIVLVVSEESSQIAVAQAGALERDVDAERLRAIISGNAAAGEPMRAPSPPKEAAADVFARAAR
jgi:diadenylate cyclase